MRSPGIRLHKLALFGWAVLVTAVLLLLSLPVLAGKPYILPALNLAICWELFYNNFYISQSAGNLLSLNFLGILRDNTPEYFCCNFVFLPLSVCAPIWKRSFYSYTPDTDKSFKGNTHSFCSYLTGLIEGDGTIVVPKTLRSPKGKVNYASIQIVFNLRDLPLALMIQKELGLGSLSRKKGVNAYVLTINSYEGLYLIISIINGNMKTPKIHCLYNLIDFLNQVKQSNIEKKPINNSSLDNSAWLSGFIEAHAYFQVRTTLLQKYPRYECKLEICQRRIHHKGYDNLYFLKEIAIMFDTTVKETRSSSSNPEYRVRTVNVKGNLNVQNYLINYPLFGSKHLDSISWMNILDLFVKGEHKTQAGKAKIVEVKSTMNDRRTLFTWDHLQNFYSLKI